VTTREGESIALPEKLARIGVTIGGGDGRRRKGTPGVVAASSSSGGGRREGATGGRGRNFKLETLSRAFLCLEITDAAASCLEKGGTFDSDERERC